MSDEQRAWLRLLRTPRLGSVGLLAGIERHSSAVAWIASAERPKALAQHPAEVDLQWLQREQRQLLTWNDPDYPALLRQVADPPAALWVVGDTSALWQPQLAVVGSRNASAGGLALARDFSSTLARSGLAITSGLALGIDGAAHSACLDAGGISLAAVGHGPDQIYPRSHRTLAERIIAEGAIVSEFPPGTSPKPGYFPRRNRIIAGLALGTLVVEAGLASGSLITARLASEAGREVFAIPGSIHNPLAKGCHRLIRDGAKLVESAQEIYDELAPLARQWAESLRAHLTDSALAPTSAPGSTRRQAFGTDDAEYLQLCEAMGFDPVSMDELVERTGLTVNQLSSMLLKLELDGEVVSTPGGRYSRTHERG